MANFGRENFSTEASVDMSRIYAQGAFKNVYKGQYVSGKREGQDCVCKIFKSGNVFEASYFNSELKVRDKTLEIINRFNRIEHISKRIWLNMPAVWTDQNDGKKCLVEPMIANFEKFNSNTGWTPRETSPWIDVMQALSHYSYHTSNRHALVCDLQGGIYSDGFVITDPVVMSTSREFGPTDLGPDGISTFFSRHRCNQYCRPNWLKPHVTNAYFPVQKGSAMILPTRASRTPLTGRVEYALGAYALGSIQE